MKNIVTVGVNFKRAQVAVAELLSRDNRDKETGDGDLTGWEMLETVKSNISKIELGIDICELTCHRGKLRDKEVGVELGSVGFGTGTDYAEEVPKVQMICIMYYVKSLPKERELKSSGY